MTKHITFYPIFVSTMPSMTQYTHFTLKYLKKKDDHFTEVY